MTPEEKEALDAIRRDRDWLATRLQCVVRNAAWLDAETPHTESGWLTGPAWTKVAHLCGLGSTSAIDLCRRFGIDPHFNCQEAAE